MQLKRNKEMEFEILKKNYKKQIIIGALAVCVIGGALTFNLTKAKYKVDGSIDLAKGTVNYKIPDMRIVAVKLSEDGTNYTDTNGIPTSGYTLNNEKSMCKVYDGSTSIENAPKDNNITIEYKEGKIDFLGITKRNTRCYLYFDKKITSEDTLAKLNITPKDGTPDFSVAATTDEGVYAVSDGMYGGTSYYWRGAVPNNYIKFANFCWRIVRINGDGSIRLIYDGATCHANGTNTSENIAIENKPYNTYINSSSYVGWTYTTKSQRPSNINGATDSIIKIQTENWYNTYIKSYESEIANGKYCNDRNIANGDVWSETGTTFNYAAVQRLKDNKTPLLSCYNDDIYELKVGAITADEVAFAGGVNGTINNAYYLYNGQSYWTMTPERWFNGSGSGPYVFRVYSDGRILAEILNIGYFDFEDLSTNPGIRPVINLHSDVTFSGGDGTQNNPYVVE